MNAAQMIDRLRVYGLSDMRIAKELGVCQSSIHKMRRGIIKNPLHATVRGLEVLYHLVLLQRSQSFHTGEVVGKNKRGDKKTANIQRL